MNTPYTGTADLIEIMSRQSPRPADQVLRRANRSASRGRRGGPRPEEPAVDDHQHAEHFRGANDAADHLSPREYREREQREVVRERSRSRPRSASRGREQFHDYHHPSNHPGGDGQPGPKKRGMKKRSQSLGGGHRTPKGGPGSAGGATPRHGQQVALQRDSATLNLYHVSRPEPRARWVFNLSKHTNVLDNGPPPETITSTIDQKRPNLGGLVWVNATLGGHCCLQRGTKSKTVTPVPADVLDGWLNGQTGIWWIGALKDGHRGLWDSHVVKNWAMVFIPSSPEVAARNNMEVWKDKCLWGSLRVARGGELARKVVDIVADDQDSEPESVVHTHLCILLAEGDDLELKRPRMFPTTPSVALAKVQGQSQSPGFFSSTGGIPADGGVKPLRTSKSMGNVTDAAAANGAAGGSPAAVDLSQVELGADGVPKLRDGQVVGGEDIDGEGQYQLQQQGSPPSGGKKTNGKGAQMVQDALQKVERYRERILILKEDRQAKKAMLAQLQDELKEKEEVFTAENERLRQERNEIKERAKILWMDLENLRTSQAEAMNAGATAEQVDNLRAQVDRLRRERNDARGDAMRWLEEQKSSLVMPFPVPSPADNPVLASHMSTHSDAPSALDRSQSSIMIGVTRSTSGGGGGVTEHKAAAAIAKLRAKVERLRKERDSAEKQAAQWLSEQKEKLKEELAAAAPPAKATAAATSVSGTTSMSDSPSPDSAAGNVVRGGGSGKPTGPIVASLKAESLRLKRELDDTKMEAKRWRDRAAAAQGSSNGSSRFLGGGSGSGSGGDGGGSSGSESRASTDPVVYNAMSEGVQANGTDSPAAKTSEQSGAQARKALGQLLGQALNLLDPAGAAAVTSATTAAEAGASATRIARPADKASPSSDTETILAGSPHALEERERLPTDPEDSASTASNSNGGPRANMIQNSVIVAHGGE